MELPPEVYAWQDRLELDGKLPRTREAYLEQIKRLASWSAPRLITVLTLQDLEAYFLTRKRAGMKASTLAAFVGAARSFYGFLGTGAAVGLKFPKVTETIQRTLTEQELFSVLAAIDTSTLEGKRDSAMLGLMVATGLRASEICRVRLADVDLQNTVLRVMVKGNRLSERVFDEYAASLLASWVAVRPAVARDDCPALFVSLAPTRDRGGELTRVGVKIMCKRLAERAGIAHFSPHALRRTMATLAANLGAGAVLIQMAGDWSDLRQVQRYTRAARARAFIRFSPLANIMLGNQGGLRNE